MNTNLKILIMAVGHQCRQICHNQRAQQLTLMKMTSGLFSAICFSLGYSRRQAVHQVVKKSTTTKQLTPVKASLSCAGDCVIHRLVGAGPSHLQATKAHASARACSLWPLDSTGRLTGVCCCRQQVCNSLTATGKTDRGSSAASLCYGGRRSWKAPS